MTHHTPCSISSLAVFGKSNTVFTESVWGERMSTQLRWRGWETKACIISVARFMLFALSCTNSHVSVVSFLSATSVTWLVSACKNFLTCQVNTEPCQLPVWFAYSITCLWVQSFFFFKYSPKKFMVVLVHSEVRRKTFKHFRNISIFT